MHAKDVNNTLGTCRKRNKHQGKWMKIIISHRGEACETNNSKQERGSHTALRQGNQRMNHNADIFDYMVHTQIQGWCLGLTFWYLTFVWSAFYSSNDSACYTHTVMLCMILSMKSFCIWFIESLEAGFRYTHANTCTCSSALPLQHNSGFSGLMQLTLPFVL